MVKRKHLCALALCILDLAVWRVVPLHAEVQDGSAARTLFAYSLTPGQVTRYKISQRVTGTRTTSGSRSPTRVDLELVSWIRLRCVRVLRDGLFEFAIDTEDEYLRVAGKAIYGYQPSDEVRTVHMTRSGKVAGPASEKASEPARRRRFNFGSVESIILMAIMPDNPVSAGDTWSADIPLPIDSKSELKLSFKLQEVKRTEHGAIAVIKQTLSTPINEEGESAGDLPRGSQNGESNLLFDIEQGGLLSAEGTIRSRLVTPIDIPLPGSMGDGSKNVETLDLKSDFKVELLPEKAEQARPAPK